MTAISLERSGCRANPTLLSLTVGRDQLLPGAALHKRDKQFVAECSAPRDEFNNHKTMRDLKQEKQQVTHFF